VTALDTGFVIEMLETVLAQASRVAMARRHRGVLKFTKLAARLNGVQIPVFGEQWTPPECESAYGEFVS
jgi:hypothetical protein